MKVYSFGCSFTFGTELSDVSSLPTVQPSHLTWPALTAKRLQAPYICVAMGGSGNLCIMDRVLKLQDGPPLTVNHGEIDSSRSLMIINWTMIDRFDYSNPSGIHYHNGDLDYLTIMPNDGTERSKFYYSEIHSEYRDKITNLLYVKTAIDMLQRRGTKFVMTCLDDLLFCQKWHAPRHVIELQEQIKPFIFEFEGMNFLDWSRHHKFPVGPGGHPLDEAHAAAAELIWPAIESTLHKA